MDQIDLLRQLVGVLDRMDIPYMVVGSQWAQQMGLEDIWRAILQRLGDFM